jgi:hypothetical protein
MIFSGVDDEAIYRSCTSMTYLHVKAGMSLRHPGLCKNIEQCHQIDPPCALFESTGIEIILRVCQRHFIVTCASQEDVIDAFACDGCQ